MSLEYNIGPKSFLAAFAIVTTQLHKNKAQPSYMQRDSKKNFKTITRHFGRCGKVGVTSTDMMVRVLRPHLNCIRSVLILCNLERFKSVHTVLEQDFTINKRNSSVMDFEEQFKRRLIRHDFYTDTTLYWHSVPEF